MQDQTQDRRQHDVHEVFSYLTVEKADLYRSIMRAFVAARSSFAIHLRVSDVVADIGGSVGTCPWEPVEVEAALKQLCLWRNLQKTPDTADVSTVEEFYRPRYLYQLTAEGEAAEHAIAAFEEMIRRPGELQAAALGEIRSHLEELAQLTSDPVPDAGKVWATLSALRQRFDELTSRAQAFIGSLQRSIDLHDAELDTFLAYKELLIDYLKRFIHELLIATTGVSEVIERIEQRGVERLIAIAAERQLIDRLIKTDEARAEEFKQWELRWRGLRGWFLSDNGSHSQAEILRERARSAIPALLLAVSSIHDRRVSRSDRSADFRTLARWFAQTDNDREAHQLWRAAFGLSSARHLRVDPDCLAEREAHPISPETSWLEAPPVQICPRLRAAGRYARRGRPRNVIDRSAEKAKLEQAAALEAEQIEIAQRRLATGRRMRLSQIGRLEPAEFRLFLDLLGAVLTCRRDDRSSAETTSSDGTLSIDLQPTNDGEMAVIETSHGRFCGPDHFVTISRCVFDEDRQSRDDADHPVMRIRQNEPQLLSAGRQSE